MKDRYHELLRKFLDHRCSQQEQEQVRQLLQLDEYRQLLEELMIQQSAGEWDSFDYGDPEHNAVAERWKLQLHQRIEQESMGRSKPFQMYRLRQIAAVIVGILFVAGGAFVGYKRMTPNRIYLEQYNASGAPIKYLLSDGTAVYLAAGSHISYPQIFLEDAREVVLDGEAFFDVTPNRTKPFIIHTGDVQTQVLGTSFRISSFDKAKIEIAVATGKVQVTDHQSGKSESLAVLTKGQKIRYNTVSRVLQKEQTDVASLEQWASGEVYFDGQQLQEITQSLERIYGATFRFEHPGLGTNRLSATFSATEPLESVMEMLAFVGKFKYHYDRQHQVITLYDKP